MAERIAMGSEVYLPSRGIPYDGKVPEGRVIVCPMTADEELMLSTSGPNSGTQVIDSLITKCVSGLEIKPDDLVTGDRTFLIMAIRAVSNGQSYEFTTSCDSCNGNFKRTINVPDDLEMVPLKDDWKEPFSVTLPVSGYTLDLRLLRGADERDIKRYEDKIYKTVDPSVDGDPVYRYRMCRHIVSLKIDDKTTIDNKSPGDMGSIIGYFRKLQARDTRAIRDCLSENDCGINQEIEYNCPRCRTTYNAMMPLKTEFFRPGGNKGIRYI